MTHILIFTMCECISPLKKWNSSGEPFLFYMDFFFIFFLLLLLIFEKEKDSLTVGNGMVSPHFFQCHKKQVIIGTLPPAYL